MGLKGLFSKVMNLARGVSEEGPASEPAAWEPAAEEEPIRTKTMAGLLAEQGHLDHTEAIYRELGEKEQLAEIDARRALASGPGDVALVHQKGLSAVAWQIDDTRLARARALLGEDGRPTLRLVRVTPDDETGARRDHEDQSASLPKGVATIETASGDRLVVSVGLIAGDRFVSIAHATG